MKFTCIGAGIVSCGIWLHGTRTRPENQPIRRGEIRGGIVALVVEPALLPSRRRLLSALFISRRGTEPCVVRYLRDPLFLFCVGTYFVNRFVFKRIWKTGFVHEHLNDLICIPFWLPIMLFAQRKLDVRDNDDPPHASEIVIPLILWSWILELLLPAAGWFGDWCVSDYLDVVAYTVGALMAAMLWRWWYGWRPA